MKCEAPGRGRSGWLQVEPCTSARLASSEETVVQEKEIHSPGESGWEDELQRRIAKLYSGTAGVPASRLQLRQTRMRRLGVAEYCSIQFGGVLAMIDEFHVRDPAAHPLHGSEQPESAPSNRDRFGSFPSDLFVVPLSSTRPRVREPQITPCLFQTKNHRRSLLLHPPPCFYPPAAVI